MIIHHFPQRSPEWYAAKKGKIGGTRFGQVISGKRNGLLFELLDERLSEFLFPDDYIDDDMQFGIDNEPIARSLYSDQTGIEFIEVGIIESDYSDIHIASPDGINIERGIILEIKCTRHGKKQIERFFNGVDSSYMPQIINYFAVSDEVKEVHWVSYCPERPERPLIPYIFTRNSVIDTVKVEQETEVTDSKGNVKVKVIKVETPVTIQDRVDYGRSELKRIESELNKMETEFTF